MYSRKSHHFPIYLLNFEDPASLVGLDWIVRLRPIICIWDFGLGEIAVLGGLTNPASQEYYMYLSHIYI